LRLKRCYDEGKRMFFASLEEDYILEEDEKEPAAEEHPF
jgi:hypothetical protein